MKKKSNILVNTLVLLVVTFVAVFSLALVNQITKEPIAQAEINARAAAYKTVYPTAENFAEIDGAEKMIADSPAVMEKAGYSGCTIYDVLAVADSNGATEGYVISASSSHGYGGEVQVAIGINDSEGKITGFDVIQNNETPGFGAKCTEDEFKSQFAGKAADMLKLSKTGATTDTEFDAIAGATITSTAVEEAVNAAVAFYQENFGGGVKEATVDPALLQAAFPEADISAMTDIEMEAYEGENYTVSAVGKVNDGYIITVSSHNGFMGNDLTIALGIGNDSMVKGFSVIKCDGTPGYGDKSQTEDYAKMFNGLKAEKVTTVASGASVDNNEIDAIAGATFSTTAVETAVNGAIEYYNSNLKGE